MFFFHMVMSHDVMICNGIMIYHRAYFVPYSSRIYLQQVFHPIGFPRQSETLPVPLAKKNTTGIHTVEWMKMVHYCFKCFFPKWYIQIASILRHVVQWPKVQLWGMSRDTPCTDTIRGTIYDHLAKVFCWFSCFKKTERKRLLVSFNAWNHQEADEDLAHFRSADASACFSWNWMIRWVAAFLHEGLTCGSYPFILLEWIIQMTILGSVVLRYLQIHLNEVLEIKAFLFGDDHQLPQKVILPVQTLNF